MITLTFTHDMAREVIGNTDYLKNRIPKHIFDPYEVLLADQIHLHSDALSIHREFEGGTGNKFAVTLASEMLQEAGVLSEVDPKIPAPQVEYELAAYLVKIGTSISAAGIIPFSEQDAENVQKYPVESLGLKNDGDNIPHVEFLAQTPDHIKEMILEDAYAKCFSGTGPDRLHDPIGTLARYSGMMLSEDFASTPFSDEEGVSEWFFDLVDFLMPDIHTIVTKNGEIADAESPLLAHGFVPKDKPFAKADLVETEKRVNLLIKLRNHELFRLLRNEYKSLLNMMEGGDGSALLPKREELLKIWVLARAELENELSTTTRLKKYNDIISVPAAIASVFLAPISAIPIALWGTEKTLERKKRVAAAKKHPWLATAEILGRAAALSESELKKT